MNSRSLLMALVAILALLSLGSFIERLSSSKGTTLVTIKDLQLQEDRLQDRLNTMEGKVVSSLDDSHKQRAGRIGGLVRKELSGVKDQLSAVGKELQKAAGSIDTAAAAVTAATAELKTASQIAKPATAAAAAASKCNIPCIDVAVLYHEDDKPMFVDNGVLHAIKVHLKNIRKIHIISASDATFRDKLDDRTVWFDEARVPFKKSDFEGRKSDRPLGWLYQQTLKFWAAQFLPDSCDNVMFVDSDTVFLRDFDVVTQVPTPEGGCKIKFKYNLSSKKSGAWDGDIDNPEYHHFVQYMTGMPKALMFSHTAINHWQLMQRDVVQAMARSIKARLNFDNTTAAMLSYGLNENGMSEYEAYFTFAWYFYQDRLDMVHVAYIMREPKECSYWNDETSKPYKDKTIVTYFTCHDNYGGGDWYTNCKGRETQCDPALTR